MAQSLESMRTTPWRLDSDVSIDTSLDIAAEDYASTGKLFQDQDLQAPQLLWNPAPAQLPLSRLARLLTYWQELRGERELPAARDIDPLDFKYALGYIMLLDVIDGGADFHYRLYGTEIANAYKRDMQHLRTSAFDGVIKAFFLSVYRAVLIRRKPIFSVHQPPRNVYVRSWRRLILPLSDGKDPGEICRFLVGNIPEDPVHGRGAPDPWSRLPDAASGSLD